MTCKSFLSGSLIFVVIATAPSLQADSTPFFVNIARVQIYYYGWDVLTRSRISLDAVRQNPKITTIIQDKFEIVELVRWLRISNMNQHRDSSSGTLEAEDPRLVIDFFDSENKRITYYARRFRLLSEDAKNSRPIDDEFRRRFTFVAINSK